MVLCLAAVAVVIGPALYSGKLTGWKSEAEPETAAVSGHGDSAVTPSQLAAVKPESDPSAEGAPGSRDTPAVPPDKGGGGVMESGTPEGDEKADVKNDVKNVEENKCLVDVAVVGDGGGLLFGPAKVTLSKDKYAQSDTPLGALDATGLNYKISAFYCFVEEVAGLRNKGQSGWMYKVNGEIPMVAADEKKLKNGDRVIWWYSKGVGTPAPEWEDLDIKQNPGPGSQKQE